MDMSEVKQMVKDEIQEAFDEHEYQKHIDLNARIEWLYSVVAVIKKAVLVAAIVVISGIVGVVIGLSWTAK